MTNNKSSTCSRAAGNNRTSKASAASSAAANHSHHRTNNGKISTVSSSSSNKRTNGRQVVTKRQVGNKVASAAAKARGSMSSKVAWIKRFCSLDGNEFLCEVDRDYITDKFNLTGLEEQVTFYKEALEIILDIIDEETLDSLIVDSNDDEDIDDDDDEEGDGNNSKSSQYEYNYKIQILASAELLYGLIHARFILTDVGLNKMRNKYTQFAFGRCTRVYCEQAAMLPVGLSDAPHLQPVRLYCPRCMDMYVPHLSISSKYISIDGAYFGTNFPHMFFMVYPEARPTPPTKHFTASLYGFQIHPAAYEYQQGQSISAKMAKSCPMQLHSKGNYLQTHHQTTQGGTENCNGQNNNNTPAATVAAAAKSPATLSPRII